MSTAVDPKANQNPGSPDPREAAIARLKTQGVWNSPMPRRQFISTVAAGWAIFAAAFGGLMAILGAFMAPRVDFGKSQVFRAGPLDNYPPNKVSEEFKDSKQVWLVRDHEKLVALSTVCTHLGCTPIWAENEAKFKCPCHGSGFYGPKPGVIAGINFEGPAPRPLERFKVRLTEDGQVEVDKSRVFLQEKGEWDNPESYIAV
jgi:cytochrome b6-f complex iron-sulfur subunit